MDFNYPSHRWTSLAHVIENRLCIVRTAGLSSWKAVTLVPLRPHSLKNHQQPPLKHTVSDAGEKELKLFQDCISCDLSLHRSFSFMPYRFLYNVWINNGNMKGSTEILEIGFFRACILNGGQYFQGGENWFLEGEENQILQWFVTLHIT